MFAMHAFLWLWGICIRFTVSWDVGLVNILECHIYEKCGSIVLLMKVLLLCCTFTIFAISVVIYAEKELWRITVFLWPVKVTNCKSLMLVKPLWYHCCLLSSALRGCHDLFIVIQSLKCNFLRGVLTHVVLTIGIF